MLEVNTGDKVTRWLAGTLPMPMVVLTVVGDVITCSPVEAPIEIKYEFDRATGAEIDEELGWGPKFGVTGSVLKLPEH